MTKFEIGLLVLCGIGLAGLIVLLALGKDTSVVMPIVTALFGALFGAKKEAIAGVFRK